VEKAFKSVDFQSRRESLEYSHMNGSRREMDEFLQPNLFEGDLKEYQMTGMNWLINLYNQARLHDDFYQTLRLRLIKTK
jgi:SNF2 family DNA or RNA helicase